VTKKTVFLIAVLLCINLIIGCASSYQKEVKKKLKKEIGVDYPSYTFRSQPVGNFGVGTMYELRVSDKDVVKEGIDSRWLKGHSSTWFADGISEDDKKEIMKKLIITGNTGKFSLSDTITTKLGLEATVPIKEIVNVGVGIDYKKGVTVTLKADSATDRQLDITAFQSAAKKNKFNSDVQDVIKEGEFIIGAKDVVLNGYSAEIKIDKSINPKLDLALNQAVGKVIGADAKMKLSAQLGQDGTYIVSASEPVVAAVLWKTPPKSGTVHGIAPVNIDNWETRVISMDVLNPLEKLLTE
jgi:hypothetical protein